MVGEDDEKPFQLLRSLLRDQMQPFELRETAMYALLNFDRPEVLQLLLEVARRDPEERMQQSAIYYLGQRSGDNDERVGMLIDLYRTVKRDRTRLLEALLYSIGSVGNDRAVEFLSEVARTDKSIILRRRAIYYLGNIGGEKSREVLYEILKSK